MRTILHKTNYGSDICLPSDWTGCLWLNKWWDMTNNTCTVIVGVRWLAQYKCAHYSSRHSCDRVELACASHLSLCASSSCFHSCPLLSLPPSFYFATTLPHSHHFFSAPLSHPCCLVKMTECEDMMKYFLSSLWISLCTNQHAHTPADVHTRMYAHTARPMYHIKVSWDSLTVMSLISAGYHHRSWHILQQSTARILSWGHIWV